MDIFVFYKNGNIDLQFINYENEKKIYFRNFVKNYRIFRCYAIAYGEGSIFMSYKFQLRSLAFNLLMYYMLLTKYNRAVKIPFFPN